MNKTRQNSEELLASWLNLYSTVWNERIVTGMTFNEAYICNLLLRCQSKSEHITATDLCSTTGLLKSQMNKTLSEMENKGYIFRTRSTTDKRVVYITISEAGKAAYLKSHEKTMVIMDELTLSLGEAESAKTAELLNLIAGKMNLILREGRQ